jgi:hypothetical protein
MRWVRRIKNNIPSPHPDCLTFLQFPTSQYTSTNPSKNVNVKYTYLQEHVLSRVIDPLFPKSVRIEKANSHKSVQRNVAKFQYIVCVP